MHRDGVLELKEVKLLAAMAKKIEMKVEDPKKVLADMDTELCSAIEKLRTFSPGGSEQLEKGVDIMVSLTDFLSDESMGQVQGQQHSDDERVQPLAGQG